MPIMSEFPYSAIKNEICSGISCRIAKGSKFHVSRIPFCILGLPEITFKPFIQIFDKALFKKMFIADNLLKKKKTGLLLRGK